MGREQAFGFVLLRESDCTGDSIPNIGSLQVLEVHLRGKKADHAPNVRNHTRSEQAGDVTSPKPTTLSELFVNVVRIVVTGDATEQGDISIGEGAPEGEGLPYLYGVESFFQLLLKLWSRV